MSHTLLGSLFIISLTVLRVLIRVFDVLWLFFYFDICEYVTNIVSGKCKINKGVGRGGGGGAGPPII